MITIALLEEEKNGQRLRERMCRMQLFTTCMLESKPIPLSDVHVAR